MERPERETVDTRDDTIFFIEPSAERGERGRHGELLRGEVAEAQAEDVGLTGGDAVAHA